MSKEQFTDQRAMQARLRGVGARFLPDRSSRTAHIYWSGSMRKFVMVRRKGNAFDVSFHTDCPCSSMIGDD